MNTNRRRVHALARTAGALAPVLALLVPDSGCRPTNHAPAVQSAPGAPASTSAPATARPASAPAVAQREIIEETWPDGRPKLRKEVRRLSDGTLVDDGAYTTWFPDGQKQYEGTLVSGRWDGVARTWHDNGQLATEEHFRDGLRHGRRRAWDRQGRLRKEEFWADDRPDGVWTTWRDNGDVRSRQEFDAGKVKD